MKKISETLTELGIDCTGTIEIKDANGNPTYLKDRWGFKEEWEYDANGKVTYHENSTGHKQGTPHLAKTCEGKAVDCDRTRIYQ